MVALDAWAARAKCDCVRRPLLLGETSQKPAVAGDEELDSVECLDALPLVWADRLGGVEKKGRQI